MPRRDLHLPAGVGWSTYNLISTIGSFILGLGILVTIANVVRSLKHGAVAGPDPWKGNTLEWFTTSPPPANNFDMIPRVRSVEPMRDIRRQIERDDRGHAEDRRQRAVRAGMMGSVEATAATSAATRSAASSARQVVADYVELTKPKVQSLLLLTTITTMEIAGSPLSRGSRSTCLGGYLSAGGAGAVNHYWDRDIDAQMARTASRPIPAGRDRPPRGADLRVHAGRALVRRCCRSTVNVLAASLALGGFVGYVGVYTIWLKRRTPQNIVIGGAAGAIPPLVGWAATTGSLSWTAVYLFAIVFYWTPPHFWALSLLMKDDYAKVGVPMMPVVRGERETRRQILLYSLLLYAISQLPFCAGAFGGIYLVASMALGLAFVGGAVAALPPRRPPTALRLYLFSLLYLALLFAAMVADMKL